MIVVDDMHQRKKLMFDKSDAFVALPGGIGTLEELVEQLTWAQLGRHTKPIVLVNVEGFWEPFLELLQHMRREAFIRQTHGGALRHRRPRRGRAGRHPRAAAEPPRPEADAAVSGEVLNAAPTPAIAGAAAAAHFARPAAAPYADAGRAAPAPEAMGAA